jgi:hypothetical protein
MRSEPRNNVTSQCPECGPVKRLVPPPQITVRAQAVPTVDLGSYDPLLTGTPERPDERCGERPVGLCPVKWWTFRSASSRSPG